MNPELDRLSDLLNESVDRGEYAGASVRGQGQGTCLAGG